MKYSLFFLLMFAAVFLTGCFEKKIEDEMLSEPEAQNELQELSSEAQENQEKNTQDATGAEEIGLSEKDTPKILDTQNTQAVPETSTSSPETIQEQQEIIQDTEEDLEALFGDLIQGE